MRPVCVAVVVSGLTVGLCSCQSLPGPFGVSGPSTQARPPQQDPSPPAITDQPAAVPFSMAMEIDYMLRLDLLESDNSRLKKDLADAVKENARLKRVLDEARHDNTLLKDLAAKKQR